MLKSLQASPDSDWLYEYYDGMCVCPCVYTCSCEYLCVYVHIYICMYVFCVSCVFMSVCVCVYVCVVHWHNMYNIYCKILCFMLILQTFREGFCHYLPFSSACSQPLYHLVYCITKRMKRSPQTVSHDVQ